MGATDGGESSNIGIPHQTAGKGPVSKIPNLQKNNKGKESKDTLYTLSLKTVGEMFK